MKLRMIAVCLLLLVASAAIPLRSSGEMAGSSPETSGQELKLPPENDSPEPVSVEHPADTAEPSTSKEPEVAPTEPPQAVPATPPTDSAPRKEDEVPSAKPTPPLADSAPGNGDVAPQASPAVPHAESTPSKIAEAPNSAAPQAATAPVPAERSWWGNIMRKLGFGKEPNPPAPPLVDSASHKEAEVPQSAAAPAAPASSPTESALSKEAEIPQSAVSPAGSASSPAGTVPRKEALAAPQTTPTPLPTEKSWWKNIMFKIGFGDDPNPGEMVQSSAIRTGVDSDYIIGPGDQIGISVWRDENLTRTVVVLPDGKIEFPLIGEIVAGGKTISQLTKELEGKLARFVSDTGVTVEVKQSNSMIIYVIGRVNTPGRQMLLANTNVLQALAMVGGLNPFAEKGNIKIFRQESGKTVMFSFNYNDVSEGRHLETNIDLKRGDVIIVP
jgi:polysaccharide biosynthesis/export protein